MQNLKEYWSFRILHNLVESCKIFQNLVESFRILQNLAESCRILDDLAKVCGDITLILNFLLSFRRSQRIKAFECTDQRVKSKTSWCSYLLYNRKISDTLKIKIEKAQIHSIPKNLLPSRIFKNVQMTKPPDFLDQ